MLDDARVDRPGEFHLPDRIWIARWDGVANTSTSYLRSDGWLPGGRMKQYQGGHDEIWGGVRINIDRNYLDLGHGLGRRPGDATAAASGSASGPTHPLTAGHRPTTAGDARCSACCRSRAATPGTVDGVVRASGSPRSVHAWQAAHGMPVSDSWSRTALDVPARRRRHARWSRSARPGSRRPPAAARAQRLRPRRAAAVTGVFDAATRRAVRRVAGARPDVRGHRRWSSQPPVAGPASRPAVTPERSAATRSGRRRGW